MAERIAFSIPTSALFVQAPTPALPRSTGGGSEGIRAILRVRLHYGLTNGDLAVAAQGNLTVPPYGQYRGRADTIVLAIHRFKLTPLLGLRRPGSGSGVRPFLQFNRP